MTLLLGLLNEDIDNELYSGSEEESGEEDNQQRVGRQQ